MRERERQGGREREAAFEVQSLKDRVAELERELTAERERQRTRDEERRRERDILQGRDRDLVQELEEELAAAHASAREIYNAQRANAVKWEREKVCLLFVVTAVSCLPKVPHLIRGSSGQPGRLPGQIQKLAWRLITRLRD